MLSHPVTNVAHPSSLLLTFNYQARKWRIPRETLKGAHLEGELSGALEEFWPLSPALKPMGAARAHIALSLTEPSGAWHLPSTAMWQQEAAEAPDERPPRSQVKRVKNRADGKEMLCKNGWNHSQAGGTCGSSSGHVFVKQFGFEFAI